MQLVLRAQAFVGQGSSWEVFAQVSKWFSVVTLIILVLVIAPFFLFVIWSLVPLIHAVLHGKLRDEVE